MKKLMFLLATILLPVLSHAQSSVIDNLFEQYAEKEGFTSVFIGSAMFNMFSEVDTEESEFLELSKSLESISILSADSTQANVDLYGVVLAELKKNKFEELMRVYKKGQHIKFYLKKKGGKVQEFIMLMDNPKGDKIIRIVGNIDLKKLVKFSKQMKIDGFDKIEKIED